MTNPFRAPAPIPPQQRTIFVVYFTETQRGTPVHRRTEWATLAEAIQHARKVFGSIVLVDRLV